MKYDQIPVTGMIDKIKARWKYSGGLILFVKGMITDYCC
jgi:hypothetical protein